MRAPRAWLAALLLLPLVGCQGGGGDRPEGDGGGTSYAPLPTSTGPPAGMDESLRDAALALVEQREQALVDGDRTAFLATVDPEATDFARTQARWWDNVAQLPATDFSLELGDEGVMSRIHGEGGLQLPIDFTMRLEGYDEHPVTQPLIYTFVGDEDEVLLTSDRNLQSDASTGWLPAPWDVTAITVRESDGVLGVFDDETASDADEVMADVVSARAAIDPLVPGWSDRVVTYDISDLDAMDRMSSMTVENTGGVAFPVMARPGRRKVAAYRFSVNPASTQTSAQRGFLFRHELVHVALGELDDSSPRWLVEGSAEYVARAAELSEYQRRAVAAANLAGRDPAKLARRSRFFYTRSPADNYEMAALVCDYLATTRGRDTLWDLMRMLRDDEDLVNMADVDVALTAELGVSQRELYTQALAWARAA
jgi:hypothetical protein